MRKLTLMILAVAGMMACTESYYDQQKADGDQTIRFSATIAEDWNTMTRSVMQQNAAAKVQQLADGLYLHTVVSPGFESDRQQEKLTRGTLVENVSGLNGHFGVSGYSYTGSNASGVSANFFDRVEVTYDKGSWATATNYTWPSSGSKIDFYGYVPYGDNNVVVAGTETSWPMRITYTVDETLASQPDLMTAINTGWEHKTDEPNVVNMEFEHQLTAVQFVIGENTVPGYITQIRFENISLTGTLTVGLVDDYAEATTWERGVLSNYTLDLTENGNTPGVSTTTSQNNIDENKEILETPLLMIPQKFANANSRVFITVNDGTDTYELSATLGEEWLPNTTVTYKVTTSSINVLRLGTVTYPTMWGTENISATFNKSDYQVGDKIGVYGVNAEGQVVFANKEYRLTQNGDATKWVAQDGANSLFVPGLTFYAYYPYQTTLTGAPTTATEDVRVTNDQQQKVLPSPQVFFSGAITAWEPTGLQNESSKLDQWDLQVGVGTVSTASTVNLSMAHTMGLVLLSLETKNVTAIKEYYLKTDEEYKWTYTNGEAPLTASNNFTGNIPCAKNGSSTIFYYVMNQAHPVTFSCTDTGDDSVWDNFAGSVTNGTVTTNNVNLKSGSLSKVIPQEYELEVGDVYFTDGALGKYGDDYGTTKTPAGIVFCTNPTDTYSSTYSHGYVMALKWASNGSLSAWSATDYQANIATVDNESQLILNGKTTSTAIIDTIKGDMEGLKYTNHVKTLTGTYAYAAGRYLAVGKALGYNTTCPITGTSSEWYLPSIGQCHMWATAFAATTISGKSPIYRDGGKDFYYETSSSAVTTAINTLFGDKHISGKYDEFITGSGAARIWSSTEKNGTHAYHTSFMNDNLYWSANEGKGDASVNSVVRAVLSF